MKDLFLKCLWEDMETTTALEVFSIPVVYLAEVTWSVSVLQQSMVI